jgi:hypothetical protein
MMPLLLLAVPRPLLSGSQWMPSLPPPLLLLLQLPHPAS